MTSHCCRSNARQRIRSLPLGVNPASRVSSLAVRRSRLCGTRRVQSSSGRTARAALQHERLFVHIRDPHAAIVLASGVTGRLASKLCSHIAGRTLLAQIEAGTAPTVLDVRSEREFADGHVPGALHIPFWALLTRMSEIPTSSADPVVVYCGHGPRAYVAGAVLSASGFRQVVYLEGHMLKWRQAGLRQEVGSGSR